MNPSFGEDCRMPPRILCIGGHDPSGGAGLQADIEAVAACGGMALTVPSCLTVQSHRQVSRCLPVDLDIFMQMLDSLDEARPIHAVKLGLLGSADQASVLAAWLDKRPAPVPVVLDPVLQASDGYALAGQQLPEALRQQLVPRATVMTPNHAEACRLSGCVNLDDAVQQLLVAGCQHVLLTGGDAEGDVVQNSLHGPDPVRHWHHPRLPHAFHGSGCTLAAALACFLAQEQDVTAACEQAQVFTQQALARAIALDDGPRLPWRRP